MSVNQISVSILEEHVQRAIEKWQNNELPSESRIASHDVILYASDDLPDPKDKEHRYNRFLQVVATDMVSVYGEDKKTFFRQLCRHSKQWQELIATKREKPSIPKQLTKKKAPKTEDKDVKVKVKKEKSGIVTSVAETMVDEEMDDEDDKPLTLEGKRQLFEEGKDAILSEVPDEVKARFGTICFAKWAKQFLPVLVMNPYSVPPGGARKLWLDMFDNLKKTDRLEHMTNLVYWYGSSNDPDNCYSIWLTKALVSYESGVARKLDQIPSTLQKKIDQKKKLMGTDQQLVEALDEMKEDLMKEPHERHGYVSQDFREAWELSTDDEGHAVVTEKPIAKKKGMTGKSKKGVKGKTDDGDDAAVVDGASIPKKKSLPGKSKKNVKINPDDEGGIIDEDQPSAKKGGTGKSKKDANVETDDEKSATKKKLEAGKPKKNTKAKTDEEGHTKKKKKKEGSTSGQKRKISLEAEENTSEVPPKKRKGTKTASIVSEFFSPQEKQEKKVAMDTDPPGDSLDAAVEPEDTALQQQSAADALIKAEQDDYEYRYAMGEIESDEDSDDDSGDEIPESEEPKKTRVIKGGKDPPKKKEVKAKHKMPKKVPNENSRLRKEQQIFAQSEEEFHPILDRWQKALVAQDRDAMMKHLQDVHGRVERIHVSLMANIDKLLTATKKVLSDEQKDTLKALRSSLKAQYTLKKDGCPPGFKPKRKYAEVDLEEALDSRAPTGSQGSALSSTTEAPKHVDSSTSLASEDLVRRSRPSAPVRRSGSLEKISEKQESIGEVTQNPKEVKMERKKFSLGNLMRPTSDETKAKGSTVDKVGSSSIPITPKQTTTLPDWVTGKLSLEIPTDDRRSFGYEFLRQAVPYIRGKGIDHDSIACALEASIDSWSSSDIDKYWKKIDDIVIALSGDKKLGTLSIMIAKGEFKESTEVIGLSDSLIYDSFIGKPLVF